MCTVVSIYFALSRESNSSMIVYTRRGNQLPYKDIYIYIYIGVNLLRFCLSHLVLVRAVLNFVNDNLVCTPNCSILELNTHSYQHALFSKVYSDVRNLHVRGKTTGNVRNAMRCRCAWKYISSCSLFRRKKCPTFGKQRLASEMKRWLMSISSRDHIF